MNPMRPINTMKELLAKWLAMDQHGCLALDCFEGKEQGKNRKTAVPAPRTSARQEPAWLSNRMLRRMVAR